MVLGKSMFTLYFCGFHFLPSSLIDDFFVRSKLAIKLS